MNFIFLGSIILLIQLPLGWTAGYILKVIGFSLCAAGVCELADLCRQQHKINNDDPPVRANGLGGIAVWRTVRRLMSDGYSEKTLPQARLEVLDMLRRSAVVSAAVGAVSAGIAALFEFVLKTSAAALVTGLLGAVNALLAMRLAAGINAFMCENDQPSSGRKQEDRLLFTDNRTDLLRLRDILNKTGICMAVNLLCDIINRTVPSESVQTYAGFMAAISKLTLYVFVITAAVRYYHVRTGFFRMNPDAENDDN